MAEVAESDWELFKELLPRWQESYMEMLISQYVEILNDDSEASSRYWALEKRINRDKRPQECLQAIFAAAPCVMR